MKRHLFTTLSALSLGLFSFLILLWARSYFVGDWLWGDKVLGMMSTLDRRMFTVASGNGGIVFHVGRIVTSDARLGVGPVTGRWVMQAKHDPYERGVYRLNRPQWLGFALTSDALTQPLTTNWGVWVVIPHWFFALCAAILPLAWLRWRLVVLLRVRISHDLCPTCGYDLRATPDRCPECGTAIAARGTEKPARPQV